MLRPLLFALALCLCFASSVSAQASDTKMLTRYSPLHPTSAQPVMFRIQGGDEDGISKVELYIYEYELSRDDLGAQVANRRANGKWGLEREWLYDARPTTINESYSMSTAFPDSTMVSYLVQTTDTLGNVTAEQWEFAAGAWPFDNEPIPIFRSGDPSHRIDVCFVAERDDYTEARLMLVGLEGLMFDGFHKNNMTGNDWRIFWSFYYSPELGRITDFYPADGNRAIDLPPSIGWATYIDHSVVVHEREKHDWTQWSEGNFGTEHWRYGTALHEAGHAVFRLSDEYKQGTHKPKENNVPDHNNCVGYQEASDYVTARLDSHQEIQVIESYWYRVEHESRRCLMLDDDSPNGFGHVCSRKICWTYDQLRY